MLLKKILLTIFSLLLFSAVGFGESIDLRVQVDKFTVTIGDRIKYEVILEYSDGIQIESVIMAGNLGEFEIKDYKIIDPKKTKDGKWISKTYYIITTFATGEFEIPPVTIKYIDSDRNRKEIVSEKINIVVESVKRLPGEKDDIRALKGPAYIKGMNSIWFLVLLILLIVSGIGILIYFKKKKHIEEKNVVPPRPPEEIAMEDLKALLDMKLVEKGMIKEYYIRLSDILRIYIEGRFRFFARDKTTWELYQEMRSKKIKRLHVDKIRDFLEDCDLVKFAKYIPNIKEIDQAYQSTKEIVEITTPKKEMNNVSDGR